MSENFETLVQRLNDNDNNERSRAAVALGNSGDARAVKPLVSTLLNDVNRYVREYAAEALDKLDWQPPGGEVSAAYFVAKRKYNSCVGIGTLAVNALIRELDAEHGYRRKEAIRALGKIGGPAAADAIKELITDDEVGEFAQDTLKNMASSSAEPKSMVYIFQRTESQINTAGVSSSVEPKSLNYCENCGKTGVKLYQGGSYTFCSDGCWQEFGRKLSRGGAQIHCPYCGFLQPVTQDYPRTCKKCHGNMDALPKKVKY